MWTGWVGIAQKTGFGLVSPLRRSPHCSTTRNTAIATHCILACA
jgi:hypothetical protein